MPEYRSASVSAGIPGIDAALPIAVRDLRYGFGGREVLRGISFSVNAGELFGLLGPNGSGKTTLFRLLSTQLPVGAGVISHFGGIPADLLSLRARLGVGFQSPSLDGGLTAWENLRHHGMLYGMRRAEIRAAGNSLLERFGLGERAHEPTDRLSGGMRRKVELAKALLTRPALLILDEPTTGLDPLARAEFVSLLQSLRREGGVTILLTTHLLDEAAECDRLAILDDGVLVAVDAPGALLSRMEGDVVTLKSDAPESVARELQSMIPGRLRIVADEIRFEHPRGHEIIPLLAERFSGRIRSIALQKPTLEDLFIALTGHRFGAGTEEIPAGEGREFA